jgi:hypothetical protein
MAQGKQPSAMLPLIIVGATLFAFGTYQSMRPKEPEVNKGFVSPPAVSAPANPRTMQAPDMPAIEKDAAARAAEDTTTTSPKTAETIVPVAPQKSVLDDEWFKPLTVGDTLDFRGRALKTLREQQTKNVIACRPALQRLDDAALAKLEEVSCTATDGSQINGEFDEDNDGTLTATSPDNKVIEITKNGDEFYVKTEAN